MSNDVVDTTLVLSLPGGYRDQVGMKIAQRRRNHTEQGAALLEFALIFPIFMTVVLGMFSGGIAYNQKITITNAARETSRYGSTLPVTPACATGAGTDLDKWLNCVASVALQNSTDTLQVGTSGRSICVAYVNATGVSSGSNDVTRQVLLTTSNTGTFSNAVCPGAPAASTSQRQVQVVMQRSSTISALVLRFPLTLRSVSVSRFER